jgi:hypothetical protein
MKRKKMMELLALLNPASAANLTRVGLTKEQLEFALFHEVYHIKVQRDRKNAEIDEQINALLKKDYAYE